MDASSIITQVYRDDDCPVIPSPQPEKVPVSTTPSKHKRPSLLKQLFCCFRPSATDDRNSTCCRGANKNNNGSTQLPQHDDHVVHITSTDSNTKVYDSKSLLPPVRVQDVNKKCVVIDLDETLVHSSFVPVKNPDFIIPVEIDGTVHQVYVLKRPHVDEFLRKMGELHECILFTASLGKYADPVTDLLDKWGVFRSRLFREACVFHRGNYVKDLSRIGRELNQVVIIDNSPASYLFHPQNAVPILTWFDDPNDHALLDLLPFFEQLAIVPNVYDLLGSSPPETFAVQTDNVIHDSGVDIAPTAQDNNVDNNTTVTTAPVPS